MRFNPEINVDEAARIIDSGNTQKQMEVAHNIIIERLESSPYYNAPENADELKEVVDVIEDVMQHIHKIFEERKGQPIHGHYINELCKNVVSSGMKKMQRITTTEFHTFLSNIIDTTRDIIFRTVPTVQHLNDIDKESTLKNKIRSCFVIFRSMIDQELGLFHKKAKRRLKQKAAEMERCMQRKVASLNAKNSEEMLHDLYSNILVAFITEVSKTNETLAEYFENILVYMKEVFQNHVEREMDKDVGSETPEEEGTGDAETPEEEDTGDAETPEEEDTSDAETPEEEDTSDAETPEEEDTGDAETPEEDAEDDKQAEISVASKQIELLEEEVKMLKEREATLMQARDALNKELQSMQLLFEVAASEKEDDGELDKVIIEKLEESQTKIDSLQDTLRKIEKERDDSCERRDKLLEALDRSQNQTRTARAERESLRQSTQLEIDELKKTNREFKESIRLLDMEIAQKGELIETLREQLEKQGKQTGELRTTNIELRKQNVELEARGTSEKDESTISSLKEELDDLKEKNGALSRRIEDLESEVILLTNKKKIIDLIKDPEVRKKMKRRDVMDLFGTQLTEYEKTIKELNIRIAELGTSGGEVRPGGETVQMLRDQLRQSEQCLERERRKVDGMNKVIQLVENKAYDARQERDKAQELKEKAEKDLTKVQEELSALIIKKKEIESSLSITESSFDSEKEKNLELVKNLEKEKESLSSAQRRIEDISQQLDEANQSIHGQNDDIQSLRSDLSEANETIENLKERGATQREGKKESSDRARRLSDENDLLRKQLEEEGKQRSALEKSRERVETLLQEQRELNKQLRTRQTSKTPGSLPAARQEVFEEWVAQLQENMDDATDFYLKKKDEFDGVIPGLLQEGNILRMYIDMDSKPEYKSFYDEFMNLEVAYREGSVNDEEAYSKAEELYKDLNSFTRTLERKCKRYDKICGEQAEVVKDIRKLEERLRQTLVQLEAVNAFMNDHNGENTGICLENLVDFAKLRELRETVSPRYITNWEKRIRDMKDILKLITKFKGDLPVATSGDRQTTRKRRVTKNTTTVNKEKETSGNEKEDKNDPTRDSWFDSYLPD